MANKNNGSEPTTAINTSSELLQLRDILFGEDKREFEAHFQAIEKSTNKQLDGLTAYVNGELAELKAMMEKGFSQLSDQLNDIDHLHAEREDQLQDFADKTVSRLAKFEQQTQQKTDELQAKLSTESENLQSHFNAQHQDALEKLTQMAASLDNNKTDRDLLANILNQAAQQISNAQA